MEAAAFSSKKKPPPAPPSTAAKYGGCGGGGGGGGYFASSYDDVFGGVSKHSASATLAPRAEEYTEIFSGFRTTTTSTSRAASSSIPVLDLPAVDGDEFDVVFDYDVVFGGLRSVDFAVPFDELFRSSDGFDASDDDDDDDAWTPVGTESFSDNSDPFAFSEKSQCSFNSNSEQPVASKQFNVSYHKVNPGTSAGSPDTIHVAQLNDFPGYTCVVEQATSLREMDKEKPGSQAVKDNLRSMETPPVITQKHLKKSSSHLSHEGTGLKSLDGGPRSGKARSVSMSHVNTTSTSPSDINLPTKSSQFEKPSIDSGPPPVPAERNRGFNGLSSAPKTPENCGFEAKIDGSLPPFFDMEVDASSSAAASAAAMKDVMEKAQAKLKAAREFRGRKDSFQNGVELSSETVVNGGSSFEMAHTEFVPEIKKARSASGKGAIKMKSSSKTRHSRNMSQILPETLVDEPIGGVNGQSAPTNCSLPVDTACTDVGGEWKEAQQYFEYVSNDNSRSACQSPSNGDGKKETFRQPDNNDNDSDSAGESQIIQTNRPRLKATRVVSRQGYYEKMIKVAQEVHDTVTSRHAETKEGLQDIFHGDLKQQNPNLVVEPENNGGRVLDTHQAEAKYAEVHVKAEAEMKPKNVLENETKETREINGSYGEDLNGRSRNDPPVNMAKEVAYDGKVERRVKGTHEREAGAREAHEGFVDLTSEALETRKYKESREVKDTKSKIASGHEIGEERARRTFVSKEKDRTEDVQRMEAEFCKPTKAPKDGVAKEKPERSCGSEEKYQTTKLQEVHEHEEYIKKTSNGHRPEIMPDQNVELERCWEYLETMEQEKSKLNLDSLEHDKKEEKVDQIAEKRNVEIRFKQADENLGDSVNINDKTYFKEDRKGAFRSRMETEREDEVLEPDSSFDIELSANDKHQTFSNAFNPNVKDDEPNPTLCMPKRPHLNANGTVELCSGEENGKVDTTLFDDSKLEGSKTAEEESDTEESRCAIPQFDPSDKEDEEEANPAPLKMPKTEADGFVELSVGKENDDIGTAQTEEARSKSVEATNVIDERQTVLPEAHDSHECPREHKRRPVHPSQTPQMNGENTNSGEIFPTHDQNPTKQNIKLVEPVSDPKFVKASHLERGGMRKNQGLGQVPCGDEENATPAQCERSNAWNEHPSNRVGAHSTMPGWKERVQRTSQVSLPSQNNGRSEKIISRNGSLEPRNEDKETDLEKEHLRKLEEEREREREREKDKMAVEIAIREARERAYADARDRAERAALEKATEEAKQRAMTEARERLEKACAEARERSSTNKASEARFRAERAAVERATAEARQRAIEKSMADRAMFETRERVQRTMSEKYTSERDVIMRQSSFPTTSERSEAGNGEPAERCKARLERHRRTVERVAKALEEKNMRDLLAQREQAERNRFAETLDADIKRWSNGKAGNLRALLSTLQYILGPESGWQPIPLTEVITAAAVKKAYRKATLCVHPDKLQQRGASIQQKYISEKVFDLLKEAWNRFNSEEK
ncbi:hypothetical protein vseg_019480 [Gypsophila vaccaria]